MGELENGVMAVAAPLFDLHREVVAALSIGGSQSRISAEKLHSFAIPLKQGA